MDKIDIKSLTYEELEELILSIDEKSFRAKQIYSWIHEKLVSDFDEMSNISVKLREVIKEKCKLINLKPIEVLTSEIDGTMKFLFMLEDGDVIESVLMKYKHGNSVCLSTQAGCRQGCRFCASTIGGLNRNLEASEILEQVYQVSKISNERVSNIVLMGTGEPLDNYSNVLRFIRTISGENGLHISQRNITMSTCGLVPMIYELVKENLQITLAISLHAPNDAIRKTLMPVANKYSIEELIKACEFYFEKTGRRISFEYSLINGENDSKQNALELARLVKNMNCHVNLIPVNPVKERAFEQSTQKGIEEFKKILERQGVTVTLRREMGRDIQGACGQLRRSHKENIL